MIKRENNISKKISFLLFLIFFFVGILTFKDYGISVDEEFNRLSGFYWLNYILSFTSFDELKNIVGIKLNEIIDFTLGPAREVAANHPYYGVVFDLPLALIEVIFKINDSKEYFHLRHLLTFVFFFVSSIFFFVIIISYKIYFLYIIHETKREKNLTKNHLLVISNLFLGWIVYF